MKISFECFCPTQWGETVYITGAGAMLGNWDLNQATPMFCVAPNKWKLVLEKQGMLDSGFEYKYFIKAEEQQTLYWESGKNRTFSLFPKKFKNYHLKDQWQQANPMLNAWESSAFTEAIFKPLPENSIPFELPIKASRLLTFDVKAPRINKNQTLLLSGNCNALGNWDLSKAIPMSNSFFPTWKVALSMAELPNTIEYKYVIIDKNNPESSIWEGEFNRIITIKNIVDESSVYQRNDGYFRYTDTQLKGAGVSLPVFSIKTKQSFGVGEFTDLKEVFNWAAKTGLHMVQILPINDTQSSHNFLDSYPYKAISVFALHPLFLNLFKMGSLKNKALTEEFLTLQKTYNQKPAVEYDAIVKLKLKYSRLLFAEKQTSFLKSTAFRQFFENNKYWLVPYAAFSYLRDTFGTSDFTTWKQYSKYSSEEIDMLTSPDSEVYEQISLWYFVQFHLDKQLKEACEYGRKKGIALKGDIPIGISRHSVDAWYQPHLYHFDGQAGAPPDDFSVDGQNWGFPTYNWEVMAKNNFQWWRNRLTKMSEYFDAYRIDHILGFFRIWEIPYDAVQGIPGHFRPALPFSVNELQWNGIGFDLNRFCLPYIRGHFLNEIFGSFTEEVIEKYLMETSYNIFQLKPEFSTQRHIYNHFIKTGGPEDLSEENKTIMWGLIRLAAEVLLLPDNEQPNKYHPRISMHDTFSYKELDGYLKEKFNEIYIHFFYHRHESFWKQQATEKLPALVDATNMLICGEDLGMIPASVPEVMNHMGILSLEIQRMPKDPKKTFAHPADAPYLSVCTTSTHDMSTVRGWWEESREKTQHFYHEQLGKWDEAPYFAEPWVCKEIIIQHMHSPAMWTIFPIQDLLAMDEKLRFEDPHAERINVPSNPRHYWKYRMHLSMEELLKAKDFNTLLKNLVTESGRLPD